LIFAAAETTSGAMTRILEQLACYENVQTELRLQLKDTSPEDSLNTPLLDAVINETLRLYVVHQAAINIINEVQLPTCHKDGPYVCSFYLV
jgi:cytochrome P450